MELNKKEIMEINKKRTTNIDRSTAKVWTVCIIKVNSQLILDAQLEH